MYMITVMYMITIVSLLAMAWLGVLLLEAGEQP
jgi:hypothetical protein